MFSFVYFFIARNHIEGVTSAADALWLNMFCLRLFFCQDLISIISQLWETICFHWWLDLSTPPAIIKPSIGLIFNIFFKLVFKLQTKMGTDHFLEACSREERDDWAADITTVVDKLRTVGGEKVPNQQEPAGSQLHNINLRWVCTQQFSSSSSSYQTLWHSDCI